MSLTSYRAAPPRGGNRRSDLLEASREDTNRSRRWPGLIAAIGVGAPMRDAGKVVGRGKRSGLRPLRRQPELLARPGDDLLSHR